jgi:hypothetical protein
MLKINNIQLADKVHFFLMNLTPEEMESLLDWIDQEAIYDEVGNWIEEHKPGLADKLFGER